MPKPKISEKTKNKTQMKNNKKPVNKGKKNNNSKIKRRRKILKWTSLIILASGTIALVLLSDLFNIKNINVIDNNKITEQEIISLSELKINENMFKFLKIRASENIKKNPYIETVKIYRKLNGTIEIKVKERVATYILPINEQQYAYINNQGYILEINEEKIQIPEVIGYSTENIEPGNRLDMVDLKKLNTVIQILNTAKERGIAEKITSINIENEQNYIIVLESEGKTVYFGDFQKIDDKFVKLLAVLNDTAGENGKIFLENLDKVYFRREV